MDLTEKNKAYIDSLSAERLLSRWRFAPIGDPWLQGETGKYWGNRLRRLRESSPEKLTAASKRIGWDKGGY
jgi:hypothetical protein